MTQKTVTIASRASVPVRIAERHPDPSKPGLSPPLRTFDIAAGGHPDNEREAFTPGVDRQVFENWIRDNQHHPAVAAGQFRIADEDEAEAEPEYGHEPALRRAAEAETPLAAPIADPGKSVKK